MLAVEASEKLGVSPAVITKRIKQKCKDVSEKKHQFPKYRKCSRKFLYEGSYRSLLEISRLCEISLSTLKQRKRNGWADYQAFTKSPAKNGKK
jgi:DNA-binding Lrp family transcriptional regulator